MKVKKILIVFGTRPEAIKMAPLVKEFQKHPVEFDTKVCVTAQHREMLDQVLNLFQIVPDYDLNIMSPNQDLFDVTTKVLLGMRTVFDDFNPDIVIVHGDTTTSFATSIAAFYKKIKIAHVEAGLRTNDLQSPWPEEMNRQITDKITDYYFAPTEMSKNNLLKENISLNKLFVTGNTVIDALLMAVQMIENDSHLKNKLIQTLSKNGYKLEGKKMILVTGHRRENFGDGFLNICKAIKKIAIMYPEVDIVYPVHLNPNVQKPVYDILSGIENVYLIKPLDYLPFVFMMQNSYLILTDSGGVQEEAPALGKPVLVMRDATERPEAIAANTVKLVGTYEINIFNNINLLLNDNLIYNMMSKASNPYGDGKASERIVNSFLNEC